MQWKEVFVFPLRRPGILLKLWLMHLLPLLAMIPFLWMRLVHSLNPF